MISDFLQTKFKGEKNVKCRTYLPSILCSELRNMCRMEFYLLTLLWQKVFFYEMKSKWNWATVAVATIQIITFVWNFFLSPPDKRQNVRRNEKWNHKTRINCIREFSTLTGCEGYICERIYKWKDWNDVKLNYGI